MVVVVSDDNIKKEEAAYISTTYDNNSDFNVVR